MESSKGGSFDTYCSGKALALNHVVVQSCTNTILRKP